MSLPVRAGLGLFTRRFQPLIRSSVVRNIIAGRSRSETPQAVPDGSTRFVSFFLKKDFVFV